MIDELRQIAIFAMTVKEGSFRAAGQALNLSPSVISHHVGQLERRLGTPLLYRSTRKLSLTEDGRILLNAAHTMLEAAETGLRNVSREDKDLSGTLRLAVPALLTQSDLFSHIADFSNKHLQVKLIVDCTDTHRNIIADGYDLAITPGPIKSSSLKSRKLYQMQRTLVVAAGYARKHHSPTTPTDLNNWQWLRLSSEINNRTTFYKEEQSLMNSNRLAHISANDTNALLELALANGGLALLPRFLVEPYVKQGRLIYLLEDWWVAPEDIFIVWPPNVSAESIVKKFVRFLSTTVPATII